MKKLNLLLLAVMAVSMAFTQNSFKTQTLTDTHGYTYKAVDGDPFGVREYTLKNGLRVFLSVNNDKPEISTMIAVKAGSTYDPKETTGLAHYLEHLMFKGTDKIGSMDWDKEQELLKQISDQFELHKATTDADKKIKIYAVIDSLSQEAAKYAAPSEYDKLAASLGAKGTNAFTSNEETVFINTIPSNQVEKWLTLESERFSKLVLRLFHTELETVYEEFNSGQSSDRRQAYEKFNKLLFPTYPYGTQTTIGKAEHLKNPSMVNINNYWKKYYVANNMAIIMTGDLNLDETIVKIDKHFGHLRSDENLSHPTFAPEEEITSPQKADVYGPEAEFVLIGFRTEGANQDKNIMADLIGMILSNGQAGLIDIDLLKSQKVLKAYAYHSTDKDYGTFTLSGNPREGQSLEEVESLLLTELEKVKKGEFDDWLQDAIINNEKLSRLRQMEYNYYIYSILSAFILDVPWQDEISRLDKMEKLTKQDIVEYANKTFKDNFVVVYKRKGENTNMVKVDKPTITPIEIDRTKESEYLKAFNQIPEDHLTPDFVNYKGKIQTASLGNVDFNYIQNKNNELTSLNFIIEMGQYTKKELELAVNYFTYMGTANATSEELAKQYFQLGVYTGVSVTGDRSNIYLSGLNKNFEKALTLFIDNIKNAKPDQQSFKKYIESLKKERANDKLNKWQISSQLTSYATYGKDNPARYNLSNEELDQVDPEKLVVLLNHLLDYKHSILYYGPLDFKEAYDLMGRVYTPASDLMELPAEKIFPQPETSGKIYFTDYDMVQSNINIISKNEKFNADFLPYITMFNEFYGLGLSSIVFQEMREAKGLVYSAYSMVSIPDKVSKSHYVMAAMNTQPDKMGDAIQVMNDLLNKIPDAKNQFEDSRKAALKKIESKRITKTNIFWTYLRFKKLGIDYNVDQLIYKKLQSMTYEDFSSFFDKHIADKKFDLVIMGKKDDINFDALSKYGEVEELSLDDLFNY